MDFLPDACLVLCDLCGHLFGIWLELKVPLSILSLLGYLWHHLFHPPTHCVTPGMYVTAMSVKIQHCKALVMIRPINMQCKSHTSTTRYRMVITKCHFSNSWCKCYPVTCIMLSITLKVWCIQLRLWPTCLVWLFKILLMILVWWLP